MNTLNEDVYHPYEYNTHYYADDRVTMRLDAAELRRSLLDFL
jgi:hypothetical protein